MKRRNFLELRDEIFEVIESGVDPGKSTNCSKYCPILVFAMKLVISDYGVFLGVRNGMISIKKCGEVKEIAIGNVEQIIIATKGVSISSALLRLAFDDVDIIILNRWLPEEGNIKVRKEQ